MSNGEPQLYGNDSATPDFRLDEPYFELFFKQHFVSFCTLCQAKFGFELDEAKEVVHMAFIKLWEVRATISNGATLRSYMAKVVLNSCLDVLKHEKTRQKYSSYFLENNREAYEAYEMDKTDFKKLAADIQQAVAELPEQMRHIFELSRNEGMKYNAIAAQLNISVKTVETQMSRALVKLRQKLGHYLLTLYLVLTALNFL